MMNLIQRRYMCHSRKEILKAFQSNLLDLQMTNFNTMGTKVVALALSLDMSLLELNYLPRNCSSCWPGWKLCDIAFL